MSVDASKIDIAALPHSARRRVTGLVAFVVIAAALVSLPWFLDDFTLKLVTRMLIFGLAAMGVDLLVGFGGMVPLGHACFMGLGAYTAGIMTQAGYGSAFAVWPAAIVICTLTAVVIGSLSLRSSGLYFIMITLAFSQMIYYVFQSLSSYGGDDGFPITRNTFAGLLDPDDNKSFYLLTLLIVGLIGILLRLVVVSQFGVVLRAARDNQGRLAALGLPSFGYRLVAFAASGAIGGLAGAMLANLTGYITPSYADWQQSGEMLVMVLLGAPGTIWGALLGAGILLGLQEFLSDVSEHWMFYLGFLIVLRVLFFRGALTQILKALGATHVR